MNEGVQGATCIAPGRGKSLDVFGICVDVLLTAEQTGGAFSQYAVSVPPGEGPPPHTHTIEHESFIVLEGEFDILCGTEMTRATVGTCVFLPRHLPHTFKNVGETTGRLLGTSTPSGHERFFEEMDRLSKQEPFPMEEALAVCERHGMKV